MRRILLTALVGAVAMLGGSAGAAAAEIKVLTAGAFKEILLATVPDFEKATGHKVTLDNATVGVLTKRIEDGEAFDLAVMGPAAIDQLTAKGKFAAGSQVALARVGVGVVVKDGMPKPDVGTVDAFKRALLAAASVAYIDPKAGGSSGIYIAKGEAELGLHQISEILPVTGAVLVGPLPAEIQNYTVYAAAVGASARDAAAAKALVARLAGPETAAVLKAKGMEPAS